MTVAQLIAKLRELPQELPVAVDLDDDLFEDPNPGIVKGPLKVFRSENSVLVHTVHEKVVGL